MKFESQTSRATQCEKKKKNSKKNKTKKKNNTNKTNSENKTYEKINMTSFLFLSFLLAFTQYYIHTYIVIIYNTRR